MANPRPTYHIENPATDIYVGDNREILSQIEAESIDLIFADPPFNWDVDYGKWQDNMPRDEYLKFTYEWLDACIRVLAPHGSIWINIPDDTVAEVVVYLKNKKLSMINWCIWHFRFGQCRNSNFIVSKAHVLYFAKDPTKRIWNPEQVFEPSDRATTYADVRTRKTQTPGLRVPLDVWYGKYWGRIQGNNKERRSRHENQIPEVYMERIIRACSDEGDLVLDPFLGSGTTCTVARALGRRSIGIEYSKTIAKSAFERIKNGPVRLENSFETAVMRAFFSVHDGESTEEVIINDSLRKAFVKACDAELTKLGLQCKKESDYNWAIEILRKEGKLGRVFNRKKRRTALAKDPAFNRAKEAAEKIINAGLSEEIDRVMCDPDLRKEFDRKAKKIAPRIDLYLIRKAALNYRKKGQHKSKLSAEKNSTLW
ncbi:MAG: site-specific DNA-methyltransferase [Sedimentisphaerales bacterium]|nr:site-specific DNA-methyltransferase [Sedimentisphaerales bacterium]